MSIKAYNLDKEFGTPPTRVIQGITLEIEQGEFIALTGRSGSGKSTLLYILSSLDTPTRGTVELSGKDINQVSQSELHRFRNENIGFVFQFHYLLPELSALENVLMPTVKCNRSKERHEFAEELLLQFGLDGKMHRLPRQLSGGEQQRVAIARSLILDPKYLFADEPTGSLDSVNGEKVMQILTDINKRKKTTVILVTHDSDFAALANRRILLADGKVVEDTKQEKA